MEIKRFDEIEFDVLRCSGDIRDPGDYFSGGYYSEGERAERALILMQEGILEENPRENWHWNGWQLTEYGYAYHEEFIQQMHKKHGHVWIRDEDGRIDWWQVESGIHNGPKCQTCGFEFCKHCDSEMNIPACTNPVLETE